MNQILKSRYFWVPPHVTTVYKIIGTKKQIDRMGFEHIVVETKNLAHKENSTFPLEFFLPGIGRMTLSWFYGTLGAQYAKFVATQGT